MPQAIETEAAEVTGQKARWARRADMRETMATKCEAEAARLVAGHSRDHAFLTQPGHIPARARQIAQTDRAHELTARASAHRAKATELRRMASRTAGDAERAREAKRDTLAVKPGDLVDSLYGRRIVLRVNTKTVRLEGDVTVDKAHCRLIARVAA